MTTSRRTRTAGLVVAAIAAAAIALIVRRPDQHEVKVEDIPGTAWVPSTENGTAVLVNGTTGHVITRVAGVAPRGRPFAVRQVGASALTSDRTDGDLQWVDGRTWRLSAPATTGLAGQELLTRGEHAWAYTTGTQPGHLQMLDPEAPHLTGEPTNLPGPIGSIDLTDDGVAWLVDTKGHIWSARDGQAAVRAPVEAEPGAVVVIVDNRPVILATGGRADVLDPVTGDVEHRFDVSVEPSPATTAGTAGDRHWVLSVNGAGHLAVVDIDSGESLLDLDLDGAAGTTATNDGGRYGRPVEHGGLVYVPELRTSSVLVVDPSQAHQVEPVDLGEKGARFSDDGFYLFVHDDKVWFDDPLGDSAGVFADPRTALVVSKAHDETTPTTTSAPPPPTSPPSTPTTPPTTAGPLSTLPATTVSTPPATSAPTTTGPPPTRPGPTTPVPTPSPTPTSSTSTPPVPSPCGERAAAIDAPEQTPHQFQVQVVICEPAPEDFQDWVMVWLPPTEGTPTPTWWAKAHIETDHCDPHTVLVWFACDVTLAEHASPGDRYFVVVRFPDDQGEWVQTLYDNDAGNPTSNTALPPGAYEISSRDRSHLAP